MEQFWADQSVPKETVLPVLGKPCQSWVFYSAGQSLPVLGVLRWAISWWHIFHPNAPAATAEGGFTLGRISSNWPGVHFNRGWCAGWHGGEEGSHWGAALILWQLEGAPDTTRDNLTHNTRWWRWCWWWWSSWHWRVNGAPDTDRDSLIQLRLLRFHQEIGRKKLLGK